jgi:hypothetical protein
MTKYGAIKVCAFVVALLAVSAANAAARTITLAWDASPDTTTAGYRVYWSTLPGTYNETDYFDVGDALEWTGDLPGDQYYFVVRAYDAEGNVGAASLEVGDTRTFWLTNPGNQSSETGQPVVLQLMAHGATVAYNVEGLPSGLDVDAGSGQVFGTVTASVPFPIVLTVTARAVDGAGHVSSVQFNWTIRTNHAPVVASPGDQTTITGGTVTLPISAEDSDGHSLLFSATNLPPGLTIESTTGIIRGNVSPAASGLFNVSVVASDGRLAGDVAFSWHVMPADKLIVDRIVSAETAGSTVTTEPFSTAIDDETLVAFVLAAQPTTDGAQTAVVSGGGLEWSRAARANAQAGTAEIWWARAPARLSDVTVTADASISGTFLSLTVVAFAAADGVGAAAAASAPTGTPGVSLTTTRPGSFVFGAGNDWDGAVPRAIPAGQELVHQALMEAGDTFWVQRLTGAVAAAGTPVTLSATAPADHRWNFAAVEIRGRAQAGPIGVSIGDVPMHEGDAGSSLMTFNVTLSGASSVPVSVNYATADGTAKAGSDYAARRGTLVFPPGTTSQTLVVPIHGDTLDESDESFSVVLSGVGDAVLADSTAVGTILNDDAAASRDGHMFGFGAIVEGRIRHQFVFRVRERKPRDHARLEFWSTEPVKGRGVDDDDRNGKADGDYRRDHRAAKNRFESSTISNVVFDPLNANAPSVTFSGAGEWNGKRGFTFEARMSDRGEPGRGRDTFMLVVRDRRGAVVLNISATIDQGNIQSIPASRR